ncbi:ATP-binding protein [Sphingomonas glaciei]|uniref:histidine kinase n=1 Tax=Sphingomonas glaciei TaxID=2938948 RepID=A0ABY5MWT8_9SPHN|nr:ATP-binding protein [Sphingomonas glaciei]UUR08923.1 response regulator [Sphingomonas glaciei]
MSLTSRLADRWKSIPAATSIAAVMLLLAGLVVIYFNEVNYRTAKDRETQVQAEILAASVAAALDFSDASAAQESADALRVNPSVRMAAVYDHEGKLVAGFVRDRASLPPRLEIANSDLERSAQAPVQSAATRIGTVRLEVLAEPLSRKVTRYTMIALLAVLAALVVVVLGVAHNLVQRTNRRLKAANLELIVQMDEREKAEEQLRQAQKMQALGHLTGGIAHDFNNLLTVIQGSADVLQRPDLSEERRVRFAAAISTSAARAANLTSQLLSFARRQPLRPETIDINEHMLETIDLLDRTLGETIEIKAHLCENTCIVDADPAQLEAAILNIGVNARDAMPGGGCLTLKTSKAPEDWGMGNAILISLSDTGTGMDSETLSRVFEPFFTTKGVGHGTGLGLSQVYGFVTQSGGEIRVESEVGQGTTVTLALPCSSHAHSSPRDKVNVEVTPAGSGVVMVVDDNEDVGSFAEILLSELGYRVVRASSGEDALKIFDENIVDCVFSDIVMPGMDGLALASALRLKQKALPIILTTGFSDRITTGDASQYPVVFKPYRIETIASVIEKALGRETCERS